MGSHKTIDKHKEYYSTSDTDEMGIESTELYLPRLLPCRAELGAGNPQSDQSAKPMSC